jgi:hypothetical protein
MDSYVEVCSERGVNVSEGRVVIGPCASPQLVNGNFQNLNGLRPTFSDGTSLQWYGFGNPFGWQSFYGPINPFTVIYKDARKTLQQSYNFTLRFTVHSHRGGPVRLNYDVTTPSGSLIVGGDGESINGYTVASVDDVQVRAVINKMPRGTAPLLRFWKNGAEDRVMIANVSVDLCPAWNAN